MSLLEDFGVRVGVTVYMISKDKGQEGSVSYTFGVGQMPTKNEVDAAVRECLAEFNEAIGATDARITHLGDQGFARTHTLEWALGEDGPSSAAGTVTA